MSGRHRGATVPVSTQHVGDVLAAAEVFVHAEPDDGYVELVRGARFELSPYV